MAQEMEKSIFYRADTLVEAFFLAAAKEQLP